MGEVGPKQKIEFRQAKIKGEKVWAASCDIRKKVDKPQKKILAPPVHMQEKKFN